MGNVADFKYMKEAIYLNTNLREKVKKAKGDNKTRENCVFVELADFNALSKLMATIKLLTQQRKLS